MSRRTLLAAGSWLAAAVLAIVVGIVAIQLVGASITGTPGGVRSQADIERALAAAPLPPVDAGPPQPAPPGKPDTADEAASSPTPTRTRKPRAEPTSRPAAPTRTATPPTRRPAPDRGVRRDFFVEGGTALAECVSGGRVRLVSWSPARGYRVEEAERGPDEDVNVIFAGPDDDDSEIKVHCIRGLPEIVPDDDDDD